MVGLLYMLSLLYNNEAFQTTDNIAVFDVTITMGSSSYVQNYTLESSFQS